MKTTSFTRAAVLFCLVAMMASGKVTVDAKTLKRNLKTKKAVVKKTVVKKALVKKALVKKVGKNGVKKQKPAKRYL